MTEAGDPGRQAPARRALLRFAAAAGGASLLSACSGHAERPRPPARLRPPAPRRIRPRACVPPADLR